MRNWLTAVFYLVVFLGGCAPGSTPSPPGEPGPTAPVPGPTAPVPGPVAPVPGPVAPVVPNDSIVTAQILSVTPAASPFSWQADLRLLDSQDVTGYVNMTKEKIGQNVSVKTKEDMAGYRAGDVITGNLRVRGDERGTFLSLSNVSRK